MQSAATTSLSDPPGRRLNARGSGRISIAGRKAYASRLSTAERHWLEAANRRVIGAFSVILLSEFAEFPQPHFCLPRELLNCRVFRFGRGRSERSSKTAAGYCAWHSQMGNRPSTSVFSLIVIAPFVI